MNVELEYFSGGINPRPNCLDIIKEKMIMAYASSNVVIIGVIDETVPSFKYLMALNSHKENIGCIKLIQNDGSRVVLISGDIGGNMIISLIHIEEVNSKDNHITWSVTLLDELTIKPYEMPLTWINTTSLANDKIMEYFVAVGSCEDYINIYKISTSETITIKEYSVINTKGHILMSGTFIGIKNGSNPLFLGGNDNGELSIYIIEEHSQMVCKIGDHTDWLKVVCAIEIADRSNNNGCNISDMNSTTIFNIATAGLDGLIVIYQLRDSLLEDSNDMNHNERCSVVGSFMWSPYHNEQSQSKKWYIYKESVLNGHGENRITDICWSNHISIQQQNNDVNNNNSYNKNPYSIELISTSEDRNIIKWSLDRTHTNEYIWLDKVRFGMLNVHNNVGFFGCIPYNSSVLTYGYDGSIYMWKPSYDDDHNNSSYELFYLISGHTNSVQAVNWEPKYGNFIVSCSKDSTCRIFVKHNNAKYGYCEMSRPQIHGFGINCVRILPNNYIASAAEEKMIRIFNPTLSFYKIYEKYNGDINYEAHIMDRNIPIGGVLRPLGLSNKAVYESNLITDNIPIQFDSNSMKEYGQTPIFQKIEYINEDRLLNEEKLQQSTLWPEYDKLYGHGNEVLVLEVNHKLNLLASACIANNKETAEIIIWNMDDWSIDQKIQQHKLTVTSLKFSPNGQYMLSASRDRTWCIYQNISKNNSRPNFTKVLDSTQVKNTKHTRIIWDCSWSYDGEYFATGSRDNNAIIWKLIDLNVETFTIKHTHAITSLAFNTIPNIDNNSSLLLAIGTELGQIFLYNKNTTNFEWTLVYTIPKMFCPGKSINEISWKPYNDTKNCSDNSSQINIFAVVSSDNSLRLYSVHETTQ